MEKIIALGCSLTAQNGYINSFKKEFYLNIDNLAVAAGSNQLQIHRLNNYYIKNNINSDTTLLWQITGPQRYHALVTDFDNCHGIPNQGLFDWIPERIELFNQTRQALLCQNTYFDDVAILDFYENLQNLIVNISQWSYIVKKIVVYLGWGFVTVPEFQKIQSFLSQHSNIFTLSYEKNIVDWCRYNNLAFSDPQHPAADSYIKWGNENLISFLKV